MMDAGTIRVRVDGPLSTTATSPAIDALAQALAAAQGEILAAELTAENSYFGTRYADLASIWDACRQPLATHGLAVVQLPRTTFEGTPEIVSVKSKSNEDRFVVRVVTRVEVVTRLCHASGQWIEGTVSALLPAADAQAIGSAITYLRRYALAAIAGVAPTDDDGERTKVVRRERRPSTVDADGVVQTAVTLESVVPFGKHKGETVAAAGRDYFEVLAGKEDFAQSKGKDWHTFTQMALASFEAAERAASTAAAHRDVLA